MPSSTTKFEAISTGTSTSSSAITSSYNWYSKPLQFTFTEAAPPQVSNWNDYTAVMPKHSSAKKRPLVIVGPEVAPEEIERREQVAKNFVEDFLI